MLCQHSLVPENTCISIIKRAWWGTVRLRTPHRRPPYHGGSGGGTTRARACIPAASDPICGSC